MRLSETIEKKSVNINGEEFWYVDKGRGIPVLILVGWGGSTDDYFPLRDKLVEKGYKVFLPDLPGLPGETASVFIPVNKWSDWVEEFVQAVIGEQFVLISHSLSSQIALRYISKKNSKCRNAVLINPWLAASTIQKIFWQIIARIARFFCPLIYPDMKWVRDKNAWATALNLISVAKPQPTIPCLILWGKRDIAKRLFTGWSKLQCEVMEYDWNHSPQINNTDDLALIIDDFIRLKK